jgi:hypothetical protein
MLNLRKMWARSGPNHFKRVGWIRSRDRFCLRAPACVAPSILHKFPRAGLFSGRASVSFFPAKVTVRMRATLAGYSVFVGPILLNPINRRADGGVGRGTGVPPHENRLHCARGRTKTSVKTSLDAARMSACATRGGLCPARIVRAIRASEFCRCRPSAAGPWGTRISSAA